MTLIVTLNDMQTTSPSIAFLMTALGRGAVASIRLQGDIGILDGQDKNERPLFHSARGLSCRELPLNDVVFGHWQTGAREEIVICRVAVDVTEIHCHGGKAAVERLLEALQARGCRISDWKQHLYETKTTLEAECLIAMTSATTQRTAELLLAQQRLLPRRITELMTLDSKLCRLGIEELLRRGNVGVHLVRPWSVVLCGRPNVGKSSLINALVGYKRSIVYDEPGTTRDVVHAETALDGWPLEFSDTAGLRANAEQLEEMGIAKARRQMESADLLVVVIDGSQAITDEDRRLLNEHPQHLAVLSKSDLPMHRDARNLVRSHGSICTVSAVAETGIKDLQERVVKLLIPESPASTTPLPFTSRQLECLGTAAAAQTDLQMREELQRCLHDPEHVPTF